MCPHKFFSFIPIVKKMMKVMPSKTHFFNSQTLNGEQFSSDICADNYTNNKDNNKDIEHFSKYLRESFMNMRLLITKYDLRFE